MFDAHVEVVPAARCKLCKRLQDPLIDVTNAVRLIFSRSLSYLAVHHRHCRNIISHTPRETILNHKVIIRESKSTMWRQLVILLMARIRHQFQVKAKLISGRLKGIGANIR